MNPINFTSILSSVRRLNIPVYQREYTWDVTRATDLLRDAMESRDQDLMIGLVVSVPGSETSVGTGPTQQLDIVDGQQRFTTISLILSVIEGMMSDAQAQSQSTSLSVKITTELVRIGDLLIKDEQMVMSGDHPESLHWKVFETLIKPLFLMEEHPIASFVAEGSTTYEARMRWLNESGHDRRVLRGLPIKKNLEAIHEAIELVLSDRAAVSPNEKFEVLKELSARFRERVTFIHYQASQLSQAFALFETLNDRGMQVASSDLIKNLCMKYLPSHMNEIASEWSNMFGEIIEEKSCIYFFRTWQNSMSDFISTQQVYRKYEGRIRGLENAGVSTHQWLTQTVKPEVKRLAMIEGNEPIVIPELHNPLMSLRYSQARQWHTAAMSALRTGAVLNHHSVLLELGNLLKELAKLMAVMQITETRGSKVERFIPEVAREIDHARTKVPGEAQDDVKTQLDRVVEKREEILEGVDLGAILHSSTFSKNAEAQFLLSLLRLEGTGQGSAMVSMTLEHIYPQKPTEGDWAEFDSLAEDEKTKACYSLGNMVELSSATNSALSNLSFQKKLAEYRRVAIPELCDEEDIQVLSQTEWGLDVIAKRENELVEKLVNLLEVPKSHE
jgi:hypothetical protein